MRNLEREMGAVLRSAAMKIAEGQAQERDVDAADLHAILGAPRFENELAQRTAMPGVATGLAWTPVGGDILFIEATQVPGSGKLILTGQLGDVMKESAQAALTLAKMYIGESLDKTDLHVHVPAGATPKDGPSAGVAMFLALASLLAGKPVRADVAMTGEISLARPGAADRRREGKGARRTARGHQDRDAAEAQPEGPRGCARGRAREARIRVAGKCRGRRALRHRRRAGAALQEQG